jgi:hypothetical protein
VKLRRSRITWIDSPGIRVRGVGEELLYKPEDVACGLRLDPILTIDCSTLVERVAERDDRLVIDRGDVERTEVREHVVLEVARVHVHVLQAPRAATRDPSIACGRRESYSGRRRALRCRGLRARECARWKALAERADHVVEGGLVLVGACPAHA